MRHLDSSIQNIIFDLGGVIINLAPQKTVEAFARLSGLSPEKVLKAYSERPEFHLYEKGLLTNHEFRSALRGLFNVEASDAELDRCWNAMLLDIPLQRIQLLEKLKRNYRVFLLSNTNDIHLQCFNQIAKGVTGQPGLEPWFHKAYYSHLLKMRKPDVEIYEHVLQENHLQPAATLFLDDNLANLEGARQAGIQTFHVQQPDLIFTIFHES